jgi:translocation and assembly module TamA
VLVSVREAKLQKVVVGRGRQHRQWWADQPGTRAQPVPHQQLANPEQGCRADQETQYIGTGLIAPPDERGWRMNAEMVIMQQASGSFDVLSQLWRVGSGKEEERIDRHYYLQYERSDTAASDLADSGRAQSISAVYNFTVRYFNSMPFPTGGWAFGADLGGGVTLGEQRVPYGRVLTRWQFFWPLGGQKERDQRAGRLSLRAQAGVVLAKADASLPATQLFLAGGDNSVRGYRLRSIGAQLDDGQVSAGRYLLTGSLEWQRPITRNSVLTEWEGVVFVDAGAVANRPSELQPQVGAGCRGTLAQPGRTHCRWTWLTGSRCASFACT